MSKLSQNSRNPKQVSKRSAGKDLNFAGQLTPGAVTEEKLGSGAVAESKLGSLVAAKLNLNPDDLRIGLEFDKARGRGHGINTGASSATDRLDILAKLINQGAIINAVNTSIHDTHDSDFDFTTKKFGDYSWAMGVNNYLVFPGDCGINTREASFTCWFKNLVADDIIASNPLLGATIKLNSSGQLEFRMEEATAASETAKNVTVITGSTSRAGLSDFHNVIAKWRTNGAAGDGSDLMELYFDGDPEGTPISLDGIYNTGGYGGIWFFGHSTDTPSSWLHRYEAFGTLRPDQYTDAWTAIGIATHATVDNGTLTINTQGFGTDECAFRKTDGINMLTGMTVEWKCSVSNLPRIGVSNLACAVTVEDRVNDRIVNVAMHEKSVSVQFVGTGGITKTVKEFQIDMQTEHKFTLMMGNPIGSDPHVYLIVDGRTIFVELNDFVNTDAGVGNLIGFGDHSNVAGSESISRWEYFRYDSGGAFSPIAYSTNANGRIDSIGIINGLISDEVKDLLQEMPVTELYRRTPSYGPFLPFPMTVDRGDAFSGGPLTTFSDIGHGTGLVYYIAGDGVTEFKFDGQMCIQLTGTVDLGVSIRNLRNGSGVDLDGSSAGFVWYNGAHITNSGAELGTSDLPIVTSRNGILDIGLHEVTLVFRVPVGTMTVSPVQSIMLDRAISKKGSL